MFITVAKSVPEDVTTGVVDDLEVENIWVGGFEFNNNCFPFGF
jgi:hypothetical protein